MGSSMGKELRRNSNNSMEFQKRPYYLVEHYQFITGQISNKSLSNEEKEFVQRSRQSKKTGQIAEELKRTRNTIKNYINRKIQPKEKNKVIEMENVKFGVVDPFKEWGNSEEDLQLIGICGNKI
jgi:hypothetical protein